MQPLEKLSLVLRHIFCWLAFAAATFWYCGFPRTAIILVCLAAAVSIALTALGWTKVWDALENGKSPF